MSRRELLSGQCIRAHCMLCWIVLPGLSAERRDWFVRGRLLLPSALDGVDRRGHVFIGIVLPGRLVGAERRRSVRCGLLLPLGRGSHGLLCWLILSLAERVAAAVPAGRVLQCDRHVVSHCLSCRFPLLVDAADRRIRSVPSGLILP